MWSKWWIWLFFKLYQFFLYTRLKLTRSDRIQRLGPIFSSYLLTNPFSAKNHSTHVLYFTGILQLLKNKKTSQIHFTNISINEIGWCENPLNKTHNGGVDGSGYKHRQQKWVFVYSKNNGVNVQCWTFTAAWMFYKTFGLNVWCQTFRAVWMFCRTIRLVWMFYWTIRPV